MNARSPKGAKLAILLRRTYALFHIDQPHHVQSWPSVSSCRQKWVDSGCKKIKIQIKKLAGSVRLEAKANHIVLFFIKHNASKDKTRT